MFDWRIAVKKSLDPQYRALDCGNGCSSMRSKPFSNHLAVWPGKRLEPRAMSTAHGASGHTPFDDAATAGNVPVVAVGSK